jgi:hypothetical protein
MSEIHARQIEIVRRVVQWICCILDWLCQKRCRSSRWSSSWHTEGWRKEGGLIAINAHYDGRVIVPDEPVDLPANQALVVRIEKKEPDQPVARESALAWLAAHPIDDAELPSDLADQHDHYLYGVPKRDV